MKRARPKGKKQREDITAKHKKSTSKTTRSSAHTSSTDRKSKAKKKTSAKKRRRIFFTILACVVIVVFIALGFGGSGDNALIPLDDSTGKINVLLLGVDEDGLRTDAIMVASYDFDDESLKLLSIPRDTKMYVTNRKVTRKINEIHAMSDKNGGIVGPLGSVEAVSALTGIPINYYVEFSFDAIDHIMDIIGPVEFDVPDVEGNGRGMNYEDPVQDLYIHLKPGLQKLSGNQVQQFLRYRKSSNKNIDGSDTSRVERQQEFVKELLRQKVNLSLIVKMPDIFSQIKKEIKTNFSVGEIARYSTHLLKLTSENISTFSLPGEDKHTSAWYFECDFDLTKELIETEFGYDASALTNRVEITGEKFNPEKAAKVSEKSDEDKKTAAPSKSDDSDDEKNTPTPSPANDNSDDEDEPEETKKPVETPTPTKKAETAPPKTEEPTKTIQPYRPTAKPSADEIDEDDDVIIIND